MRIKMSSEQKRTFSCILAIAVCAGSCSGEPEKRGDATSTTRTAPFYCGEKLPTGPMRPALIDLIPKRAAATSTESPSKSHIPSAATEGSLALGAHYFRVSDVCDQGSIVSVEPTDNAQTVATIYADDGRIVAIGLYVRKHIRVTAWSDKEKSLTTTWEGH
ncbi:hypothetical protein [Actinomadura sp. 6K520]|uniref:hypothetical protein n=1 Tax=Actinomadura sp. 6K520 TaxID=2530364 RepID=UPI00104837DE|nr:hypothetical protein [Actinomadura sp. 6K520]TDE33392.1 hypothetical protein E1289_12680 [Actinomadura sp. 6K520]